jgi:hypothetical protein
MKKLGNIKSLLSREEMKQIQGGSGAPGYGMVTCSNGGVYEVWDCNAWAVNECASRGATMVSCSYWAW